MHLTSIIIEAIFLSSLLYTWLHTKTRISLKYLYLDNLAVIVPVTGTAFLLYLEGILHFYMIILFVVPLLTLGIAFIYTMIRFWRTPSRKVISEEDKIISPADGNIIYIKKVEAGDVPISVKQGRSFCLNELTKTNLLKTPCWLIGINMTPFDVHKNCSPIKGTVTFTEHFNGKFLSLKLPDALLENERNTYVIENSNLKIGVIQIASRLVKKIDVYVQQGQKVQAGEWIGMIRFGSQVDVIIPFQYLPIVTIGQQVYAATSVLASLK